MRDKRLLIYSHDSFGLGHLRRCRAIAHALVGRRRDLSVLILSGSPIIGSFDFRARVDFVRVPGMIKLRNGEYTSLNLHIGAEETLAMRASIIRHTAEIFDPDIFLVDKEPLGLRGEVADTLQMLGDRGTYLALGLRDVMDGPEILAPEWERKRVLPALVDLYDRVWVYGLPQICRPLDGLGLPASIGHKTVYTGYLRRDLPAAAPSPELEAAAARPFVLVTAGGGGDGDLLVDWVLRAYETDDRIPHRALVVTGPFMPPERQAEFHRRARDLPDVEMLTFDAHIEAAMVRAAGVVAMGGYNTFCEILSFDKPAVIVPRTRPRLEQKIRAERAQELGLARMLDPERLGDAAAMAAAIRGLPAQGRPSDAVVPGILDGIDSVVRLTARALENGPARHLRLA